MPLSAASMALSPGSKVGPYEVTAFVGAGGMGRCIGPTTAGCTAMSP